MKLYQLNNMGVIGGRENESNIYIKNLQLDINHTDDKLHSHPDSDEYYIIIDGKILFEHEEGAVEVETGGIICFMKGELHRIAKMLTPTKVMIIKSTNCTRDIEQNVR